MKNKSELTIDVDAMTQLRAEFELLRKQSKEQSDSLANVVTRLDLIINLLLDVIPDEYFSKPRKLTHKVARLDDTGIQLRPVEVGNMLGRPSKDISSRRKEIKSQSKKIPGDKSS